MDSLELKILPSVSKKPLTDRPGVDVGDPDGLWNADFVDRLDRQIQDHKSGKTRTISLEEVMAKLGITTDELNQLED
ncbi:MAG: hypothetical protein QM523_04535 [Candidatus Pacebacteria bacterium]|nr:hypothetical protein [Candidatus Paceibacterota bacterium]